MDIEPLFDIVEVMSRDEICAQRMSLYPVLRSPVSSNEEVLFSLEINDSLPDLEVFHMGPPPWSIGFSKQFKRDTNALDRKLMGRILEVLEELSDYTPPFRARGDTFKPLKGDLEGCWRYRIGDSRLVLKPEQRRAQLNAVAFGARGGIYD